LVLCWVVDVEEAERVERVERVERQVARGGLAGQILDPLVVTMGAHPMAMAGLRGAGGTVVVGVLVDQGIVASGASWGSGHGLIRILGVAAISRSEPSLVDGTNGVVLFATR
jgi:hypothetical protein